MVVTVVDGTQEVLDLGTNVLGVRDRDLGGAELALGNSRVVLLLEGMEHGLELLRTIDLGVDLGTNGLSGHRQSVDGQGQAGCAA